MDLLIELEELRSKTKAELQEMAQELGINYDKKTRKEDLQTAIYAAAQDCLMQEQFRGLRPAEAETSTIEFDTTNEVIAKTSELAPDTQHEYTKEEVEGLFPQRKNQVYFLLSRGYSRAAIGRLLGLYYSQVHAYAKQYDQSSQPIDPHRGELSAKIRKLYDAGWERAAIAKRLGKEYSFVHNVIKRYERTKGLSESKD